MRIGTRADQFKNLSYIFDQAANYSLVLTGLSLPLSITATDIFMMLTAIFCIVSGRFHRNWSYLKSNPLVWSALWIVLLVFIAIFWSIAPWGDRFSALHKYSKLIYIPLLLPMGTNLKWRNQTIIAFLSGVFIIVVLSYLKAWAGLNIGKGSDPSAIFYSHIETSFLIAFATYLLALYAWKKPIYRTSCLLLILLFSYQEFFINNGRTGWIAYLMLLILFAIQVTGWKGFWIGSGVAFVLALSCYFLSDSFRFNVNDSVHQIEQYQSGQVKTSLGYRLSFDTLSLNFIKQKPIIGYGAGSFKTVYSQSGGVPGWKVLRTPHNEYLMFLVEFGLVGFISLLLFFYFQIRQSFHLGEYSFFAQGLILVFMISSFYNAFLYLTVSGHFYVLFTALFFGSGISLVSSKKR